MESKIKPAVLATALLFLLLTGWAAVTDTPDRKAVQIEAQAEYRAELAAASMCAAEGKTAVWNGPNEIECLKEQP